MPAGSQSPASPSRAPAGCPNAPGAACCCWGALVWGIGIVGAGLLVAAGFSVGAGAGVAGAAVGAATAVAAAAVLAGAGTRVGGGGATGTGVGAAVGGGGGAAVGGCGVHHRSITFHSTSTTPSPDGFLIAGDLTLKGVTRSIQIPAAFHGVVADPWGLRAGFTSSVTVDRRDFGITWNRVFDWGVMASQEMELSLDVELAYPDESLAQKPRES